MSAADRDLDDQAAYLATQTSLETALRFYDAASITFGKIASMPGIGEQWPSANPRLAGLRVWRIAGFEKHHGARDIDSILANESADSGEATDEQAH